MYSRFFKNYLYSPFKNPSSASQKNEGTNIKSRRLTRGETKANLVGIELFVSTELKSSWGGFPKFWSDFHSSLEPGAGNKPQTLLQ